MSESQRGVELSFEAGDVQKEEEEEKRREERTMALLVSQQTTGSRQKSRAKKKQNGEEEEEDAEEARSKSTEACYRNSFGGKFSASAVPCLTDQIEKAAERCWTEKGGGRRDGQVQAP
ncbi:hypothetical protein BBK36DRAFT_1142442 [Trichoderma citrinoviride]|uniref:Uncharacterized protein n=1 Tax=Trichoderma citrinoviride TaxID=58853 RepID=A0A2T4B809_9HYPO|nr:hypothetical protein BBK36DRAFT_1142442 [Trichoderma citrinoviride]PTB65462.1 hypothetical protein BBK36DRAFT_1142442 [Trichoderma citrinoviride]